MVAGIQGSRMDDQRADFNFPGLNNSDEVIGRIRSRQEQNNENMDDYDNFFDMLMKCQVHSQSNVYESCLSMHEYLLFCTINNINRIYIMITIHRERVLMISEVSCLITE